MQNDFIELWCLLDFVLPGYFNLKKDFRAHYAKPMQQGQKKDASPAEVEKVCWVMGLAVLSRFEPLSCNVATAAACGRGA